MGKNEVTLVGDEKGLLKYTELIPYSFMEPSFPKNLKWLCILNNTIYYIENSLLTDVWQ